VSDDQVIAQAMKALRAGPLHSHLVRERPKTVPELYEQFEKCSKSDVQHFYKLEHKGMLQNQTYLKDLIIVITNETTQILYIASILMVAFIGKKPKDFRSKTPTPPPNTTKEVELQTVVVKPPYCKYHGSETNHHTKDCSIYLDTKKKMEQDLAQPSHQPAAREVDHSMQWAPHHQ
jgi:hypothetical protein